MYTAIEIGELSVELSVDSVDVLTENGDTWLVANLAVDVPAFDGWGCGVVRVGYWQDGEKDNEWRIAEVGARVLGVLAGAPPDELAGEGGGCAMALPFALPTTCQAVGREVAKLLRDTHANRHPR